MISLCWKLEHMTASRIYFMLTSSEDTWWDLIVHLYVFTARLTHTCPHVCVCDCV